MDQSKNHLNETANFILKTDSILNYSPALLVDTNLFIIKDEPYKLEEQFSNWLNKFID